ncbi:MAG: sulfatase-like hydrolase/transferase [Erysipelotrichaceae bacterium]|nr:sulfatase-like hydrolase/transferase [Erysipelotrichaceae bacterium]
METENKTFIKAMKAELSIRKIIGILLLIACLVFVVFQKDSLSYGVAHYNDEKVSKVAKKDVDFYRNHPDEANAIEDDHLRYQMRVATKNYVSMKGNVTLRQTFTASDGQIKRILIFFHNPGNYSAEGKVTVSVEDQKGKEVCSSELAANLILNDQRTQFDFIRNNEEINAVHTVRERVSVYKSDGINIKKGAKYTIVVKSENLTSDDDFSICLGNESYNDGQTMTVNGKDYGDKRIHGAVILNHAPMAIFSLFAIAFLIAIVLILIPASYINEKMQEKGKEDFNLDRLITRVLFFLTPLFVYYICYKVSNYKLTEILKTMITFKGVLNLLIIVIFWYAVYALTNRTKISIYVTTVFYFVFILANYFLNVFRGSPLVAADILSIGTAMDVAANYVIIFNKASLEIIVLSAIFFVLALTRKPYKSKASFKVRMIKLLVGVMAVGGLYFTFFKSNFVENNNLHISGFDTRKSYKLFGYPLSFLVSVTLTRAEKPSGYSVDAVNEIAKRYESDSAKTDTKVSKTHPNMIVVMNEAYSDLAANGKFKTSADYMPFVRSLKENTVRGTVHTSIFGGSTANSEFEFLTGSTMSFLPFHSVAYNNFIHDNQPSTTTSLEDIGYKGSIAFHPGMSDSYNRNNVYPYLGFDEHVSLEDLEDPEYMRSFVSDDFDFKYITERYEKYKKSGEKAPFWLFNVTIQNHSGFKLSTGVVDKKVTITDDNANGEEAQQYLNLIRQTDMAFENMVNYFKKVDEPTVIVMYGDHQPRVEDKFYNALHKRLPSDMTALEIGETMYQVPLIMWANYDIEEETDVDISINYLSAFVRNKSGMELTAYDKYLLDLHEKIPVLTDICYVGDDGVMYDPKDKSKYSELINEYHILQYNNLIDYKNRVEEFFRMKQQ